MTQGQWKRIHEQATGALPVGTLTKWGVVLVSLLLAAFLVSQSLFNSAPEEEAVGRDGRGPTSRTRHTSTGNGENPPRSFAARSTTRSGRTRAVKSAAARFGSTRRRRRRRAWRDQRSSHSSRSQRHCRSRSDCAVKRGRGRAERSIALGRNRAAQALAAVRTGGAVIPRSNRNPGRAGSCGNSRRDGGCTSTSNSELFSTPGHEPSLATIARYAFGCRGIGDGRTSRHNATGS